MIWPTIFIVACASILGISIGLAYRSKQNSKLYVALEEMFANTRYKVLKIKDKAHDYIIESDNKRYLVKVVYASSRNEIVLTNARRWYLNALRDSTKVSKNIRIMNEIEALVNYKAISDKDITKVFIIYTGAGKIVRYINESELEFVTPRTDCWGYKVINFSDLKEHFNEL